MRGIGAGDEEAVADRLEGSGRRRERQACFEARSDRAGSTRRLGAPASEPFGYKSDIS
jgi:hypothetical protein